MHRNSKEALHKWVGETLIKTNISLEEKTMLAVIAGNVIKEGGYRGDISDKWRERGYTTAQISDLY